MAFWDFDKGRVTRLQGRPLPSTAAEERQSSWQRAVLGLSGTFLVLMGIGIGILTLRFALVLMHGVLH